jgi:hypothetical protein
MAAVDGALDVEQGVDALHDLQRHRRDRPACVAVGLAPAAASISASSKNLRRHGPA